MKKTLLVILAAGLFLAFGQFRQLQFPPGTALLPGLAVDTDRKSGLFQKDGSTLGFAVNGVESFAFTKRGIVPAYGEFYISTAAGTSNTSGTPLKALGTTTLGDTAQFDMPANNRLRYTGAKTSFFHCSVSVAASADKNNLLLEIYLADNGAVDLTTRVDRQVTTPTDHAALGTGFIVELERNEYVELWLDSSGSDPTITMDHAVLRCIRL
jgi:hypothetical protein